MNTSVYWSVDSRLRVAAVARTVAPARAKTSLPPAWSKCQWVLISRETGLPPTRLTVSKTSLARMGTPESTTVRPSGPLETAMLPPGPWIRCKPAASSVSWIGIVAINGPIFASNGAGSESSGGSSPRTQPVAKSSPCRSDRRLHPFASIHRGHPTPLETRCRPARPDGQGQDDVILHGKSSRGTPWEVDRGRALASRATLRRRMLVVSG